MSIICRNLKGLRGRRGLGMVSTMVGGNLIVSPPRTYGSSGIVPTKRVNWTGVNNPTSPIEIGPKETLSTSPSQPGWGTTGPSSWGGKGGWGGPNNGSGWGGPGGGRGSQYGYGSQYGQYGQNPNNPNSQNNLAQLTLLYQQNPSALTQQQWQQLQAAGVIPSTVPYSDASLVNPAASTSTAATGTTAPATTTAATGTTFAAELESSFAGIPVWMWLLGGGVLVFVLTSRGGRR